MLMKKPDNITLFAFLILVTIGGSNAVAVRFSNLELPPYWGAASRFGVTALIFWIIVLVLRISPPKGRGLTGAMIFGFISVGLSYAFLYWGLLEVPASLTMVVLALTPLMTFFFALAHGLEKFRWRGLAGALIALTGILIGVRGGLNSDVPLPSLLAVLAGAVCFAEGNAIFKLFPKSDPVAVNAVSVSTGAVFLTGLSLIMREEWRLPETANTWVAFGYLTLIGSVVLFYLYLFVLGRWTASATSYSFLLFPISTILIAAWLAGEPITASLITGGVFVLVGVWMGVISRPNSATSEETQTPEKVLS